MSYFIFSVIFIAVAFFIHRGMIWYENLAIPIWKPNGFILGLLYALMAVSLFALTFLSNDNLLVQVFFVLFLLIFIIGAIAQIYLFFDLKKMSLASLLGFFNLIIFALLVFTAVFVALSTIWLLLAPFFWLILLMILAGRIGKLDRIKNEFQ
jgi:tryptophan-rich sensory protein